MPKKVAMGATPTPPLDSVTFALALDFPNDHFMHRPPPFAQTH